jgi:uncharacterized protein YlzI (FlbEa/FlbD family)
MIQLHRLNGQNVVINAELIETVESHGQEALIRLTTGNSFVVKEDVTEVLARNLTYRQAVAMERRLSCP